MKSPSSGGVRFAPSPTGKFHVGNLRTAWISYQFSRSLKLPWVVRFEDIDQPRVLPGAREQQLADLARLTLISDFDLLQSEFRERHWQCFIEGVRDKKIYPCDCSRKEVQQALSTMATAPHTSPPTYSGRCRRSDGQTFAASESLAWRFKMEDESGKDDFIVARTSKTLDSSGLPDPATFSPAYHLACAVDDHDGDYDLLVRSSDLRESLKPQRAIQKWLGSKKLIPVFHTSLIVQNDGKRLEKRTQGVTLEELELNGVLPSRLIEIFERSFTFPKGEFLTDPSFGESNQTMSLSQLGIQTD